MRHKEANMFSVVSLIRVHQQKEEESFVQVKRSFLLKKRHFPRVKQPPAKVEDSSSMLMEAPFYIECVLLNAKQAQAVLFVT